MLFLLNEAQQRKFYYADVDGKMVMNAEQVKLLNQITLAFIFSKEITYLYSLEFVWFTNFLLPVSIFGLWHDAFV
jgi:hypothetical protein